MEPDDKDEDQPENPEQIKVTNRLSVKAHQLVIKTNLGDFVRMFSPSKDLTAYMDVNLAVIEALSKDPQQLVYIDGLDNPNFKPRPVKIECKFEYPDDGDSAMVMGVSHETQGPYGASPFPHDYSIIEDTSVVVHTDFKWLRQTGHEGLQDIRCLKIALSNVRAVDGIQSATFLAPHTLYYSYGKMYKSKKMLIEKEVRLALCASAAEYKYRHEAPAVDAFIEGDGE